MELSQEASELSVGQRVAEMTVDYSQEHVQAYERVVPHYENIHNSVEAAAKAGFAQPFASGTMVVVHTIENLLPGVFGEGWTHAGSLNTANVRPILMGSQVHVTADVIAKLPRGDNTLVVMQLNATLPNGDAVVLGQASALARG